MHIPYRGWIIQPKGRKKGVSSPRLTSLNRVQGCAIAMVNTYSTNFNEISITRANLHFLSDDKQLTLLKIHAHVLDLPARLKDSRDISEESDEFYWETRSVLHFPWNAAKLFERKVNAWIMQRKELVSSTEDFLGSKVFDWSQSTDREREVIINAAYLKKSYRANGKNKSL